MKQARMMESGEREAEGGAGAMSEQREQGPATRTISRALTILQTFDEARPELGVTALSDLTGLDKATVYRLLSALQQGGLIEQDPATSKYHLGFGLVRLAGLALQHLDLPHVVRPYLETLAEETEETVTLSILTNDAKVINIDGVTSPRRIRNVGRIGREMPAHAVSAGKVLLAYLRPEKLTRLMDQGLERYTEHTITDAERLQEELADVRRVGYAIAEEELEEGLSAVAAPIWNSGRRVEASISVSGPSFRLPRPRLEALGEETARMAERVSQQLGHSA
jgi:IclR family acetate operon transcriptional repressor